MRHRRHGKKLNRDQAHRLALGRNLCRELITHHRIVTTHEKAKVYRPIVEKLVTLARDPDEKTKLHRIRLAYRRLPDKAAVKKLFEKIGPHFQNRNGGYTRIMRLSKNRLGDNASQAILEFVDLPREKPAEDAAE